MTDHIDAGAAPAPFLSAYAEHLDVYDALNARLRDGNKAALFAALASAGLTQVAVSFDGCGDSGQIENVEVHQGENVADLPDTVVTFTFAEWCKAEPITREVRIGEAIEHLVYDYLGETHGGWQDGDGAYGEFVFDIAGGTVTLEHNERYTATKSYSHTF